MAIFFNILIKTFSIFFSIIFILTVIFSIFYFNSDFEGKFSYFSGDKNSQNKIAILETSGIIIENDGLSNLTSPFIISPQSIKENLDELNKIDPKAIIFSINSPGGTVSASKKLC